MKRIQSYHLDILKEIGNIGAGNAATAFSALLAKPIEMTVPSVRIVSFQEITELVGGAEEVVAATFLRIEGEVPGSMFLIVPEDEAVQLIYDLTGESSKIGYSEMGLSSLQELGNILAGSYLSALSDFTNLNIQPSVPSLTIDMAGAILSFGLLEISRVGDFAIVIDTEIREVTNEYGYASTGQFFLLPDPDSFTPLFHALGVDLHA